MQYLIAKKTEGKDILKNAAKAAKTWPALMLKDVMYIELALICASLKDWPQVEAISEERLDKLMEGMDKLHLSNDSDAWAREADLFRLPDSMTKVLAESDATVDAELAKKCGKAWSKFTKPPKSLATDLGELRKIAQQAVKEKKCLYMLDDEELPESDDEAGESDGDGGPMSVCHIWLGKFASKAALDKYFEENYDEDDDDAPINAFAKDQRATFYDHDWVEWGFKKGDDLKKLIKGHSWSENYMSKVIAAAEKQKIAGANTFIMADKNAFRKPRPVKGKGYELWYLGTFGCAGGKTEDTSLSNADSAQPDRRNTGSQTATPKGIRRFEFVDAGSNKFWEIQVQGNEFHVRWGRMGADGQKQTKSFSSDDEATKQAQKLIAEKLKKGYIEAELGA